MTSNRRSSVSARVAPQGSLDLISQDEVALLQSQTGGGLYAVFRQCALAVLNSGSVGDDAASLLKSHEDFSVRLIPQPRGIKLEVHNAPAAAFIDGVMIKGLQEHLFAVLRDLVFANTHHRPTVGPEATNFLFKMLRNAGVLIPGRLPQMVVCWGGHAISRKEYEYTKEVGYALGLRGFDICTGCGPGAMKGPMKGAAVAHGKQRKGTGRFLGLTEPGIIAAESPNPQVSELVILPDIEKRLEAFVRIGHAMVVFPGGVGTAEEILYLLGILQNPANTDCPFPLIFTGRAESADYFQMIDRFIRLTLGENARRCYRIIIDDPEEVAQVVKEGMREVTYYRRRHSDAFYFNWLLHIPGDFQQPFEPTHESMAALALHRNQPVHELAANLRKAFSGIVAGNVKEEGIRRIRDGGPFELQGDVEILEALGAMLDAFVRQNRMKLPGQNYQPCYRIRTQGARLA